MAIKIHKAFGFAWFLRLRRFIDRHRLASILISGALGIAVVGNVAMAILGEPLPRLDTPIVIKPKPKLYHSPLTGLEVANKKAQTKPVNAVIIENSPDARPQSGLKQGEVIYEAIAEGGVTRFLVLYQQNNPKLIGPVRSLRPYFLDWIAPYNASIVHVGGSAKALQQVRSGNFRDLDQFFNDSTYYRADDRFAPHNVYTSSTRIASLNKTKKYRSSTPKSFERIDEDAAKKPTATRISVRISNALFDSTYKYDKKHNHYIRSQAGTQHKDREKGVITPKVVIAMKVNERTVREETDRESITTTGSGQVTIFQNGRVIKGTWKKDSRSDQLHFVDKDNEKIALSRGQTWIVAVPNGQGDVTWGK